MDSELIIYKTDDGKADVKLFSKDGAIWMNQMQMSLLFDTSIPNISIHVSNILQEKELDQNSVVKYYLATASDGKNYNITYYALPMVLAVGFRVRSIRGTKETKGRQTRIQADEQIEQIYLEFDGRRKELEAQEADRQDEAELRLLEATERNLKDRKQLERKR